MLNKSSFLFILLFLSFSLDFSTVILAQSSQEKIAKADQLFENKKYVEALEVYEDILNTDKKISLNALLKMAFISEALEDYSKTLYYLNLYHLYIPKNETLLKMENIAFSYRLLGYEHSDFDVLSAWYQFYYVYILAFFSLVGIGTFLFVLWQLRKRKELPIRYSLSFVLILALFFVILNFTDKGKQAIIATDNTFLMYAPSSASSVLEVVGKGHRVNLVEEKGVWYKIEWKGKTSFVKRNKLLLIEEF